MKSLNEESVHIHTYINACTLWHVLHDVIWYLWVQSQPSSIRNSTVPHAKDEELCCCVLNSTSVTIQCNFSRLIKTATTLLVASSREPLFKLYVPV